ncbi:hypothetical protein BVRB_012840 [Beta vulgaris subsp. vulgaris]|uniref:Uncharacterized protein n=1 Tax=Beta vulgaris subsp. vulgaris TaxID=3555 RepID=A0A0J8B5I3_BETVV|nr:hypothetical protein BVRB_012840 [Beta vulgaris subsp. vulgaris]
MAAAPNTTTTTSHNGGTTTSKGALTAAVKTKATTAHNGSSNERRVRGTQAGEESFGSDNNNFDKNNTKTTRITDEETTGFRLGRKQGTRERD